MSEPAKRFRPFALSASFAREITDVLVIFSIALVTYMAVANWGGMLLLQKVLGTQAEQPSFLYFFGMALVVFSLRRIVATSAANGRSGLAAELQAVQTMSMRDPLTQLPNRRQFQNDVSAVLKNSDNKMSVLLLGLHQFKKLNEVYGHLGCDEALLQIGSRIRARAAPGDIFARIGDDEFAPVSGGRRSRRAPAASLCTLVETIKQPVQIGIEHHSIGASVGIAQAGRGHVTVDELLRCAHVAAVARADDLHTEYCFFDPKMDAHIRERTLLEKDLRAAIGGDSIVPYYQPIVDLKTRRIVSFESLARWHNPVSGLILPDTFIPLAEELGLLDMVSGQLFGERLPRGRHLAAGHFADLQLFALAAQRPQRFADAVLTVMQTTPAFRRIVWKPKLPKAPWSRTWKPRATPSRRCAMPASASSSTISAPAIPASITSTSCASTSSRSTSVSFRSWSRPAKAPFSSAPWWG